MSTTSAPGGMQEATVTIRADYNLLFIQDVDDVRPLGAAMPEPWLLATESDRVAIHAGQTGLISVTTQAWAVPPPPVDDQFRARWEDIAEMSFTASTDDLVLTSLLDGPPMGGLDSVTPHGPGSYRVRVAAIGRTEYWDSVAPPEKQPAVQLLVQLWPSKSADAILYQYKDRFTGQLVFADETKRA
ncbi:hypothetical protein [Rhodococcus sp. IEGM 1307]|uniref:hypothetical protein n=1 Tax=Rhodococcus sp. IEGM 1307 TaxID=3047091 RepID=UPI0024B83ADD|nr:hypothetical protein [Rhodococcus sp. IEGM 1307]MDI9979430.1 hypothetical protein [Rhodococcus sp. IEGM 1307]